MLLKFVGIALLLLVQNAGTDNPVDQVEVTERYTLRVQKPGGYGRPNVESLVISPDGKQAAVATSRELLFVRCSDGEIITRYDYAPFSLAYSNDSRQLLSISSRQTKMFQTTTPSEIPYSFTRPKGYLGVRLQEKNGKLVIESVEPGSPASETDWLAGSELVGVGEGSGTTMDSVIGMSLKDVLGKLDGPANTKATLALIPRGKIDESKVTMTRMQINATGGYSPYPTPEKPEAVAWCMANKFHEFRSTRTGNYVSSLRCEQIVNDRGAEGTSKNGEWFAFLSQYKDSQKATVQIGKPADRENKPAISVSGTAAYKVGYKQGAGRIYGAEIYNVLTQELVASFPVGLDESDRGGEVFTGVQLDPATNRMIVSTSSTIHVYDVGTGERKSAIRPVSDDSVMFTTLAVAGSYAAVGDNAGVVRIVDLESKQLVEAIPSREKSKVTHVDLSSDAKTLTYHAEGVAHIVHLKLK